MPISVYVAQSEGGLNESLRKTVIPILELTKNDSKKKEEQEEDYGTSPKQDLQEILLDAPFVCYIYLEGLRVTW